MEIITGLLNDLVGQLQNAGNEALIFAAAFILIYTIKNIPQIPNSLIPPGIIVLCSVLEVFMGDPGKIEPDASPTPRLAIIGMILGFVAWLAYAQVLKRIEAKLGLFQEDAKPKEP